MFPFRFIATAMHIPPILALNCFFFFSFFFFIKMWNVLISRILMNRLGKFSVPWNHRKREGTTHSIVFQTEGSGEGKQRKHGKSRRREDIVKMKTKEADDELIDNQKKDFFFGWVGG